MARTLNQICKVCYNREIRDKVDRMLFERMHTQLEIAAEVGISDSSISRHKLKCWRKGASPKVHYFDEDRDRISVVYGENTEPPPVRVPIGGIHWVITVVYDEPLPPPPPPAEETANEIPRESSQPDTLKIPN